MVADWWHSDRLQGVDVDSVGNVWGCVRPGRDGALLVAAHLDTVFDEETPHRPRIEEDKMFGPGVGDDGVAVAALSELRLMLPSDTQHAIWVVGTTGEEGLGNLRGITHALREPPQPVRGLIAVEGNYLGRIATRGVGSVRFSVGIKASGGHAWEDRHRLSAVEVAAEMAAATVHLRTSADKTTSVNIGRIWGGEAINVRSESAGFEVDLRADNSTDLDDLDRRFVELVESQPSGVKVSTSLLGRRPAGGIASDHPLVTEAASVLREMGLIPQHIASSTDANAAFDLGIPAITLGITTGGGEHTRDEWISLKPLPVGIAALAQTISRYDHHGP